LEEISKSRIFELPYLISCDNNSQKFTGVRPRFEDNENFGNFEFLRIRKKGEKLDNKVWKK
jgi:hypothetical protein